MLPKHLLSKAYEQGKIGESWGIAATAAEMAGLGPFRLKEFVPGQRVTLERNPYCWKSNREKKRLPYLNEMTFLFVPSEDAQVIRFESGDTDVVSRISADNFGLLEKEQQSRGLHMVDLGPGLEYNFLFFNLNSTLPKTGTMLAAKQQTFRQVAFRQAVSAAIDRDAIIKLVYRGRGTPLLTQVTPANKLWRNDKLVCRNARSIAQKTSCAKQALPGSPTELCSRPLVYRSNSLSSPAHRMLNARRWLPSFSRI